MSNLSSPSYTVSQWITLDRAIAYISPSHKKIELSPVDAVVVSEDETDNELPCRDLVVQVQEHGLHLGISNLDLIQEEQMDTKSIADQDCPEYKCKRQ